MSSTITTSIVTGGTNSHATTVGEMNAFRTDFATQGPVGTITNTSGVSPATGSFAVNAQGTPAMFVDLSAGTAYITATPSGQASQLLRASMTATYTSYTISANASGSTKYDWIYLKVDPTAANNPASAADDVTAPFTSRSSSLSTDNGSPPTYGILLAKVTVANGATSISNSNITDGRSSAALIPSNPYKFSVYRNAAWSQAGGLMVTSFDAKDFDTNSNVDIVTNKGRFTAPIAGFYWFSSTVIFNLTTGDLIYAMLYKNGTEVKRGQPVTSSANGVGTSVTDILQLAAGDYVEVYTYNGSGVSKTGSAGSNLTHFSGSLISST